MEVATLKSCGDMTRIYHYEEFTSNSGTKMYIEQYGEKPLFVKLWRYGILHDGTFATIERDYLHSKPRKSRLIERY
jgi:hypothetical protein